MFKTAQQRYAAGLYGSDRMQDPKPLRQHPMWPAQVAVETQAILAVVREDLERDHHASLLPQSVRDAMWDLSIRNWMQSRSITMTPDQIRDILLCYQSLVDSAKSGYRDRTQSLV